ncbi:Neprilysin-1 [Araneus ventricosus]|uniref:Neprilysin-1 n=1 Tax=Araneus ventricosus TaxID=182803 RepID=A0A4Y2DTH9_ARAVE|nr:Neprilysin-1 [Araneus ventricosus]
MIIVVDRGRVWISIDVGLPFSLKSEIRSLEPGEYSLRKGKITHGRGECGSQNALAAVSHLMTMVLKATHSPNQSDNLPEYEMLANGNPGKKPAVRIQENPLAEVAVEKPPNDMVQLRIEKGGIKCQSRSRHRFRTTFELLLSLTTIILGLLCCALFYLIFMKTGHSTASLLNAMDQTSDPCDNFFQYACGTWNKLHMIPQDRSSISTFEVMADDLQVILKGLLEEPANSHDNSATIKAKTFYKSCISTVQIEAIGDKPLRDVVRELGGWPVSERDWEEPEWPLEHLLGQLRGDYNQGIIIEQWVGPDDKNSSVNVIQLDQMSFGLPSREYFLKDSSERERKAYLKLMVEVAILFGADREMAEMDMTDVLDLEIRLANASILCS